MGMTRSASARSVSEDGQEIEPRKVGLIFSPPTIVLEYWAPEPKNEMMQRHVELPLLTSNDDATAVARYVCKQNASYFAAVKPAQVARLVARLQRGPGLRKEIQKYAGAAACFQRYDGPVREAWEAAQGDGLQYWEGKAEGEELEQVAAQARAGLDAAVAEGVTTESLAQGLGRALARFRRVAQFKPLVAPNVQNGLKRIGKMGMVAPPEDGPDESYHKACAEEALQGALKELRMEGVRLNR